MANSQVRNLRVNLSNSYGDSKNVNIPNPKNNLTKAQVDEAFALALSSEVFLAGTTYYTAVRNAKIIVTTTTDIN